MATFQKEIITKAISVMIEQALASMEVKFDPTAATA